MQDMASFNGYELLMVTCELLKTRWATSSHKCLGLPCLFGILHPDARLFYNQANVFILILLVLVAKVVLATFRESIDPCLSS